MTDALSPPLDEPADAGPADAPAMLRRHVIRATRTLMASHGLGISMDQIAAAAGVSRRSLFRHFTSRDALIGEALESAFRWYEAQLDSATQSGGPLAQWLPTVLRRTHQSHLDAGRGLWQLASAFDDDLPPEFSAANRRRRAMRRRVTQRLAERAWQAAGGTGDTSPLLVDAFATVLSSFTTHSMLIDSRRSLDSLVRSSAAILSAVIDAQPGRPGAVR